jgi:esterase
MSEFIDEEGVIQFLLTSLRRGDDGSYRWRFNLAALRRHYGALIDAPASTGPYLGPALFIKGGDSDYMLEEYRRSVGALFPGAALKVMPGCGHWLHVQKPRLFNSIVRRFLDAQSA